MSDPTYTMENPMPASAKGSAWIIRIVLLTLGLAATALIAWYVTQRESPTVVVQRFCSALKGGRYEEAYALVDWRQGEKVTEKQFVQMGKAIKPFITIQKYTLGEPRRLGDAHVVPVTVTASVTSLTGTSERTENVDISCRYLDGEWKVRPDAKQGFMGLGKVPGL